MIHPKRNFFALVVMASLCTRATECFLCAASSGAPQAELRSGRRPALLGRAAAPPRVYVSTAAPIEGAVWRRSPDADCLMPLRAPHSSETLNSKLPFGFPSSVWGSWLMMFACTTRIVQNVSLSVTPDSATPWTVAHQAPRILEWVAVPSSRGSPHPGLEPVSPALAHGFFTI